MKRAAIIYNLVALSILLTAGFINARSGQDVLTALLFTPPLIYFCRLLIGNLKPYSLSSSTTSHHPPTTTHQALITSPEEPLDPEIVTAPDVSDINRRMFLKLIGGAGVSVFMMSIFTDRAHAAFFGSMPVPGAMTVKNLAGQAIDPAEKQPTDGYEISEIDDTASPAYYGFVHKTGAWYISREDDTGSYRYAKGPSDFPTGWTNRAAHTYDYFDNVF